MDVHHPVMITLGNLTADYNALEDLARDSRFGHKLMVLLNYSTINDVIFECMRILKNIVANE